jgi:hypothetical protein
MIGRARRKDVPMLEVKKAGAGQAGRDPTTARYVDRMEQEGRPVTLRIDDRPPLVIKDARAYQLLWELVDRIETVEAVREGLEQVRQGRTLPLEEVDRRLKKKHGIRG